MFVVLLVMFNAAAAAAVSVAAVSETPALESAGVVSSLVTVETPAQPLLAASTPLAPAAQRFVLYNYCCFG